METVTSFSQVIADTDGWGHMDGWGGGWMWLWGTLMMFSWVAIILAAVWLANRTRTDTSRPSTARTILDERYARGDLTTEEYRERLDHLP